MPGEQHTTDLQDFLVRHLHARGADLVGFADLARAPHADHPSLTTGVAVALAYNRAILDSGDPEATHVHMAQAARQMSDLTALAGSLIRQAGLGVWVPEGSRNLPGLVGDYSHKRVATAAGLGWVGRSSLFVSPRYGPALRLGSLLTDAPFATGEPVLEGRCGDCRVCVEACPHGAISGRSWRAGVRRDELLDARLCSGKREQTIATLGYKHPCALCMAACPVGR